MSNTSRQITQKVIEQLLKNTAYMAPYIQTEVTIDSTFDEIAPAITKEVRTNIQDYNGSVSFTLAYIIGRKWPLYKTVYDIHPSFLGILSDTEDTPINTEILARLPFPSFFVPLTDDPNGFEGMFVYTEKVETDFLLSLLLVNKDLFEARSIWLYDGKTFTESNDMNMASMTASSFGPETLSIQGLKARKKEVEDSLFERYDYFRLALNICYYLCAMNAEVKSVSIPKAKRPKVQINGTHRTINIRQWDVGYRIGQAYEQSFSSAAEPSGGEGQHKAPRPHVRRAHWHHYWCGPNKERLEVRWLEPVFVCGVSDDLVTTEHGVAGNS